METSYTWIPFYKELARKLLDYKEPGKRRELLEWLRAEVGENMNGCSEIREGLVNDIDPFTVFVILNRGTRLREACIGKFKRKFKIQAELPSDYLGLSNPDTRKANLLKWSDWTQEEAKKVSVLWDLYDAIVRESSDLSSLFDEAISFVSGRVFFTMILSWIDPNRYLPLTGPVVHFLTRMGYDVPDKAKITYESYTKLLLDISHGQKDSKFPYHRLAELTQSAWDAPRESNAKGRKKRGAQGDLTDTLFLPESESEIVAEGSPLSSVDHENVGWVPFYKELANRLLEFKDDRSTLLRKLVSGAPEGFRSMTVYRYLVEHRDIDPFTIYALFTYCYWAENNSKRGQKNREQRASTKRWIKECLGVRAELPVHATGVPGLDLKYVNYSHNLGEDHIEDLWDYLEAIAHRSENLGALFDRFGTLKNVGYSLISDPLAWANPDSYISINSEVRRYINTLDIGFGEIKSFDQYEKLLVHLRRKMDSGEIPAKTFPELSYLAHTTRTDDTKVQVADHEKEKPPYPSYGASQFLAEVFMDEGKYEALVKLVRKKKM